MKTPNDVIGDRTCDFPACGAVIYGLEDAKNTMADKESIQP